MRTVSEPIFLPSKSNTNMPITFFYGRLSVQSMHVTNDELARRFNHHAPDDEDTVQRHQQVRTALLDTAEELVEITGAPSREQSLALTHLEEAMFWANAAI